MRSGMRAEILVCIHFICIVVCGFLGKSLRCMLLVFDSMFSGGSVDRGKSHLDCTSIAEDYMI